MFFFLWNCTLPGNTCTCWCPSIWKGRWPVKSLKSATWALNSSSTWGKRKKVGRWEILPCHICTWCHVNPLMVNNYKERYAWTKNVSVQVLKTTHCKKSSLLMLVLYSFWFNFLFVLCLRIVGNFICDSLKSDSFCLDEFLPSTSTHAFGQGLSHALYQPCSKVC